VLTDNQRLFTLCQVDYLTDDEHGARDSASEDRQMSKTYGTCTKHGCTLPITTYGWIFCAPCAAQLEEQTKKPAPVSSNPVFGRADGKLDI
jgi:hypothetical protein